MSACKQLPVDWSHESDVQALPSSQLTAVWKQLPKKSQPSRVHGLPSSQLGQLQTPQSAGQVAQLSLALQTPSPQL